MTDVEDLRRRAREAAAGAHAPYSEFRVGAVVVTADGEVFSGSNVENAAYGSTVCAEANAITTAVAAGARKIDIVVTVCLDGDDCTPCGNCLQIMREFGVDRVITDRNDFAFEELLPVSFGPEALGQTRPSGGSRGGSGSGSGAGGS
jgi:cytidine deaminase